MSEILKFTLVTVLLSPTELLTTLPAPDKLRFSEPINPFKERSEDETVVFPS